MSFPVADLYYIRIDIRISIDINITSSKAFT